MRGLDFFLDDAVDLTEAPPETDFFFFLSDFRSVLFLLEALDLLDFLLLLDLLDLVDFLLAML